VNSIRQSLIKAKKLFEKKNIPALEAVLLLEKVLSLPKEKLFANLERNLSPQQEKKFFELINKRLNNFPIQYILGYQNFWSLKFQIGQGVFIPRPETELLVEKALELFSKENEIIIIDIGTGCGNIAISLGKEYSNSRIIGIDVSKKALYYANKNARFHRVHNVEFLKGNLFSPLKKLNLYRKVDLIISNPPYVSEEEWMELDEEILKYEPKEALVPGKSGLELIEKIIKESPKFLKIKGFLLLEIGEKQADKVKELFNEHWKEIEIFKDYNHLPRAIKARLS
jgi:release factor glutamine methyltransferase